MLHHAKWFGLSCLLHLAIGSGLYILSARTMKTAPKSIMVILDSSISTDQPQQNHPQTIVRDGKRKSVPIDQAPFKPVDIKQDTSNQKGVQPVTVRATETNRPAEENMAREPSHASPQQTALTTKRSTSSSSTSQPVIQSAHPPDERSVAEQVQQIYLKEHFTFIRDLIMKHLTYPPIARRMNWSGKVVVTFTIVEDGCVQGIRVSQSSGFQILDTCAIETVRSAAPFPKPPVRAEISVPINFKLMQ